MKHQEEDRLRRLSSFAFDYEEYQDELRPFVKFAQQITDSPVCEINIIDAYNQWTIARTEKELKVIPREESVCYDTIQQEDPYEISDLSQDDRYRNRSYVARAPFFRYYCGVQLTTQDGINIGSICVLDQDAKEISDTKKEQLQHLADLIVQYLEKNRTIYKYKKRVYDLREQFRVLNHDLRSPINGILGIMDLLITDDEEITVDRDDLLATKNCAEAIVEEIDGSLVSSKNREQAFEKMADVSLSGIFNKVARLHNPQAQNKDITLSVSGDADGEKSISFYASKRLVQILSNLVANALKFTEEGGKVEVLYSILQEGDSSVLQMRVKDNGVGMAATEVDKFNQGENVKGSSGTEGEESFGIGLQHVRNLVRELKGSIVVESSKGEGTEFTVRVSFKNL